MGSGLQVLKFIELNDLGQRMGIWLDPSGKASLSRTLHRSVLVCSSPFKLLTQVLPLSEQSQSPHHFLAFP